MVTRKRLLRKQYAPLPCRIAEEKQSRPLLSRFIVSLQVIVDNVVDDDDDNVDNVDNLDNVDNVDDVNNVNNVDNVDNVDDDVDNVDKVDDVSNIQQRYIDCLPLEIDTHRHFRTSKMISEQVRIFLEKIK